MEFTDLATIIRSRRSIRSWEDKEVSEDLLLQAIELATWAPNGGNQQNCRFYLPESFCRQYSRYDVQDSAHLGLGSHSHEVGSVLLFPVF